MAEVPEVDYTAEEEAAMGGETQPEGETPSVKTPGRGGSRPHRSENLGKAPGSSQARIQGQPGGDNPW